MYKTMIALALCLPLASYAGCYKTISGSLKKSGIVIFGEFHGTNESPEFLLDCAKDFLAHHKKINIALELPASDNKMINRYLKGKISASELLNTKSWEFPDGRTSKAMFGIIEAVKNLKNTGNDITLFGFDAESDFKSGVYKGSEREAEMTRQLRTQIKDGEYYLVLVGNMHAQLSTNINGWNEPNYEPFAKQLQKTTDNIISLNVRYLDGTAWACYSDGCGVKNLESVISDLETKPQKGDIIFSEDSKDFNGFYFIGSPSASIPARS